MRAELLRVDVGRTNAGRGAGRLSDRVIGKRLGVTDKTAARAIRWLGTIEPPR